MDHTAEIDATLTEGDIEEMIAHTAERDDLIAALRRGLASVTPPGKGDDASSSSD